MGIRVILDGTYTKVIETSNDASKWKLALSSTIIFPFTSPQSVSAGLYVAAVLYNSSSQTTAPSLYTTSGISSNSLKIFNFTNAEFSGQLSGQSSFPTTVTVSALIDASNPPLICPY